MEATGPVAALAKTGVYVCSQEQCVLAVVSTDSVVDV
jgi:hypothetical protein